MKFAVLWQFRLVLLYAIPCPSVLFKASPPPASLSEFLRESDCSSLTVNFTAPDSQLVVFNSMERLTYLRLNCNGVTVNIQTTLQIQQGRQLWLSGCLLKGGDQGLMDVYGSVTLEGCTVQRNKGYALYIEGLALVRDSVFEYNEKSIFLSETLGLSLTVHTSLFHSNTSPLGTVLQLSFTSRSSPLPTLISFEHSTFSNNTAYIGGSFAHVSLDKGQESETNHTHGGSEFVVSNCAFSDSSGYLLHMYLDNIDVVLSNNTISNVTIALYLQLYSGFVYLKNTTITTVQKAIICPYLNGQLSIKDILIEKVSEGPALLLTHSASSLPGTVTIQGLEMRNISQTDTTLYVSTIYALNIIIRLEDIWIHHSYSFAAGCGAYFFAHSQVTNCTFEDSLTHQGALIGHLGGYGVASNLIMREVGIQSMSAILAMSARVALTNVSIFSSNVCDSANLNNMLTILYSEASCVNLTADLQSNYTDLLFRTQSSVLYLAHIQFPVMHATTFFQAIQSNVTLTNVRADIVEVHYFAIINVDSNVNLSQIALKNAVILEEFLSVKTRCKVEAELVEINAGVCESIVTSFESQVNFVNSVLSQIRSGTLFTVYLGGEIQVTELTIQNSTFNLANCENGTVVFAAVKMIESVIVKKLILVKNGKVVLRNVEGEGMYLANSPALVKATENSTVWLIHSSLRRIRSREQGLVQMTNSRLILEYSTISDFNVSFAHLYKSSFLITQSQIILGGVDFLGRNINAGRLAGFIDATDSVGVVHSSRFHSISGTHGGVFGIESKTDSAELLISNCHFELCSAQRSGGVISALSAAVNISHSTFHSNSAHSGGVLYFQCDSPTNCLSFLSSSEFLNNSAVEGGVLKWTKVKPSLSALTVLNNSAVYGYFEASLPTHIALLNSLTLSGVAGTRVTTPIIVASLDSLNQTVKTDNSTIVQLVSDQLLGTTAMPTLNGVANFSGVIVETAPGSLVQIQVVSPTILQAFPNSSSHSFLFTYNTRLCECGEITLPLSCFLCPKNTYSLQSSDSYCDKCPSYASCPGGSVLILDQGYWRASNQTSEVLQCPNPEACAGGDNATCAAGYSGVMCSSCAQGHYLVSLVVCEKCEGLAAIVMRTWAVYMMVVLAFVYIYKRMDSQAMRMTTARILIDFLHFLLILPLVPVNYRSVMPGFLSFNEMVMSFGLHSFPLDCWVFPPAVWRAVLATAFPVGFLALLLTGHWVCNKRLTGKAVAKTANAGVLLLWIVQPYIVKTLVGLLACKHQAGHWVLSSNTEVQCWEELHLKYVFGLFVPGFLLYCVGFPLAFFLFLRKKSLFGYRLQTCYFTSGLTSDFSLEVKKCLAKQFLLFLAAFLGATEYIFQVLGVAGSLYCLLTWSTVIHKYMEKYHHTINGIGHLIQTYLMAFSYFFTAEMGLKEYILTLVSSLMLFTSLLYILICLILLRKQNITAVAAEAEQESVGAISLDEGHLVPQSSPVTSPEPVVSVENVSFELKPAA